MKLAFALVLVASVVRADPAVDPDHVPLAAVLREAFGKQIWRGGIELHAIRCTASGDRIECTAHDGERVLRARGSAAGDLIDELANATDGVDIATALCRDTRCSIEVGDGDYKLLEALGPFEADSLCQHTRTYAPVRVRCSDGSCALGSLKDRVMLGGAKADALARVIASRLDEPCGSAACDASAHVTCDSSGCRGDGGLTWVTTCNVMP